MNIETIKYKECNITIWICNQDRYRVIWNNIRSTFDGIIFVVDSSNRDRIEDYAEELKKTLAEEEYKNCVVLVMANQQDLKDAIPPERITEIFEMRQIKGRTWNVIGTSCITGEGIKEGMNWLKSVLLKRKI